MGIIIFGGYVEDVAKYEVQYSTDQGKKVGHMSKDLCRLIVLKASRLQQVEGLGVVLGLPLGLNRFRGRLGGEHVGVFSALLVSSEVPRQ
jgi:hypothetical protein